MIANADSPAFTQDAAKRLKIVADAVPVLMAYVDKDCVYRFVNKAYERWFGLSGRKIVGRKVRELVGLRAWAKIRPHLRKALSGQTCGYESLLPYKDAGTRFVAVSYVPDRDSRNRVRGVVALIEDITARRAAEAAGRREYTFSATLLKTTAALIVVLDPAGTIVHFNEAFERATGYAATEVTGRKFLDLFLVADELPGVRRVFDKLRGGHAPSKYINHIKTRDGRKRLIEWSNNIIRSEDGRVEHVIGTGVDITERRDLEKQLLAAADREQQRIGQDLHDSVGQKLAALDWSLHCVKREAARHSRALSKSCEKLSRGLRDVAHEVRILSHGLVPVSLREDGLTVALETLAAETSSLGNVSCDFSCDGAFPLTNADMALHLYRIAQEAVSNALKHAQASRINLTFVRRQKGIELCIQDDGRGFPRDIDFGLGLRLMKHRAELIGGNIQIQSSARKGTAIRCRVGELE